MYSCENNRFPKIKLILIISAAVFLSSCSNENTAKPVNNSTTAANSDISQEAASSEETEADGDRLIGYGFYDLSGEFSEAINSNPIDEDYKKEFDTFNNSDEFSTTGWIQLEQRYIDIWDKELNGVYNKLLSKLDQEQKDLLIESQKGWLEHHLKETEFVAATFLGDSDNNIGSQGQVNLAISIKLRIRDRTIQLLEYDSMLGGTVEFLYKSK
ncbi:lysozyme inhibitor LprI family protein [Paenibacillus sp. M1]|uniref:Lysozyme inhibitor LprI family protein n=1 Tax=Paenibacillus haidiansis TaxID=1574488 RepID=A0ABU7VR16_9BACL